MCYQFEILGQDQTWDAANPRRVVLGSGHSANLMLGKAKGDCTLLVLYSDYSRREVVRNWLARARVWRLFPRSKWGLPARYEHAILPVPDPPDPAASPHPK
jgi:hypothetical protein